MLATRTDHSRCPAASRAGRLVAHALLAIVMVIGVVFAHGGACAALELSEHSAHLADRGHAADESGVSADHDRNCWHRQLPEGHRHGTGPDCSATHPAGPAVGVPTLAAVAASSPPSAAEGVTARAAECRLIAPHGENICVMRI